jgi:uncharacterized membrane protein HdeD (DUF308 family)
MKNFHEYWTFLAIRGAVTIVAAMIIVAMPFGAAWIITIPVALALTADCLAVYSIFDGAVAILLNRLLPAEANRRNALFAQTAIGVVVGTLLFFVVYDMLSLKALVWIIAAQFAAGAVVESFVARDTHRHYGCLSCYSIAMVLGFFATVLPLASGFDAARITLTVAGCVALYGASQFVMGARMLFVEYRTGHPAPEMSQAWREALTERVDTSTSISGHASVTAAAHA